MGEKKVTIDMQGAAAVSGVLHEPRGNAGPRSFAVVLAHGAGNDMHHSLLVHVARGLAQKGHTALRFNFPYRERGAKRPDSQPRLERTWEAACRMAAAAAACGADRVVAAGKSMGGRVASQMAAAGTLPAGRLAFFGYPLHPPGAKAKLRDAHLYGITAPMLFFTGTRDPLCDLALLKKVLARSQAPWQLEIVEGGDHSFKLPAASKKAPEAVFDTILDGTLRWLA